MKKALAVAALLAASSAALADGQALMTAPGGAFRATHVSGYIGEITNPAHVPPSTTSFETFCIEQDEFFTPGTTYFAQIADSSMGGGSGGPSPDPVSNATAALYRAFRNGTTIGTGSHAQVVNDNGRENNLQNVIWAMEEELAFSSLSAKEQNWYNWAIANQTGLNGVRVMRLWSSFDGTTYSGNVQDMLTIVPLPTAAWAGLGTLAMVLGTGYIRRRAQQA